MNVRLIRLHLVSNLLRPGLATHWHTGDKSKLGLAVAAFVALTGCANTSSPPATGTGAAASAPATATATPPPPPPQAAPTGGDSTQPTGDVLQGIRQARPEDNRNTQAATGTKPTAKTIDITPLTQFEAGFASASNTRFSDTYTRLVVTSRVEGDAKGEAANGTKPEPYRYKSRSAIERYFFGANHTINLTAKISVGNFTATVPLVTIGHVSNATDGEGFTRTVYHQAENYPLFLVKGDGSNAIVSVQFAVKGTDQYQGSAAALIQTAQVVIKAVAPHSAVLTTLTQQSTKDVASALDTTISKLLATSIDEEPWVDGDIRRWGEGASVQFLIPKVEGAWDKTEDFAKIGTWTVKFADPRPSIFSDEEVPRCDRADACAKSFAEAARKAQAASLTKPEEVLAFQLINGAQSLGTVAAYLKQQEFWTTAQKAFQGTDKLDESVSQFCRSVKNSIAGLNLNSIDAGIVVVAVRKAAVFTQKVVDAMEKNRDCSFAL